MSNYNYYAGPDSYTHFGSSERANTCVGGQAMGSNDTTNKTGSHNSAFGNWALYNLSTGIGNTAIGSGALQSNQSGYGNTGIGYNSGSDNVSYSVCIGMLTDAYDNSTAVGYNASAPNNNSTALGANATTTGDNQIQLGDSQTDVYLYNGLHFRSDSRDTTDIQETPLGLDFILSLNPVQYKWDKRVDYEEVSYIESEEGKQERVVKQLKKDGSKKGKRFHQGFIAQDFQNKDVDFGGFQDNKINGGDDMLALNYSELIAPLVKAIQEQQGVIDKQEKQIEMLNEKLNALMP